MWKALDVKHTLMHITSSSAATKRQKLGRWIALDC